MTRSETHTCDACLHEVGGSSKVELGKDGWEWHKVAGKAPFVLCSECVALFEKRRAETGEAA